MHPVPSVRRSDNLSTEPRLVLKAEAPAFLGQALFKARPTGGNRQFQGPVVIT